MISRTPSNSAIMKAQLFAVVLVVAIVGTQGDPIGTVQLKNNNENTQQQEKDPIVNFKRAAETGDVDTLNDLLNPLVKAIEKVQKRTDQVIRKVQKLTEKIKRFS